MRVRVLVVDDNADFRTELARGLASEPDIDVVGEANGGAAAIMKVAELGPDVVIMDLEMSGVDGFEATRLVKRRAPETSVIILMTEYDDELRLEATDAGV